MRNPHERIGGMHGAGGEVMGRLVSEHILPKFALRSAGTIDLDALDDGAALSLPAGEVVVTTDAHVVNPLFFPGGDIGRLAACGTVNDLAVMGAKPVACTLAMVLEEGFPIDGLDRILSSCAQVLKETETALVAGDTKVMGQGELDGAVLTMTGIGVAQALIRDSGLQAGDVLLVTGPIGDHGMALLAAREEFHMESDLLSDVAPLWPLLADVLEETRVTAMKDPTRGGVAAAVNEMARKSGVGLELDETSIPVRPQVRTVADLLGLDPLQSACEGRAVLGVRSQDAERALATLRRHPAGGEAAIIGRATEHRPGKVVLNTSVGGRRLLEMPLGDPLPRIC
ncbi:MAG: hydrogenase expression/formation protein HypE [Candidatus Bipolaricaulota bacterium]